MSRISGKVVSGLDDGSANPKPTRRRQIMTNLIYRGVPHKGHMKIRPRVAQDLIYRGFPHDGLSAEGPAPSRSMAMRYRGVAYTLTTGAARTYTATATNAQDRFGSAHALA